MEPTTSEEQMQETVEQGYNTPKANSELQMFVEKVDMQIKRTLSLTGQIKEKYKDVMIPEELNDVKQEIPSRIGKSKFAAILEGYYLELQDNNRKLQDILDRAAV